jgi:hypothetical protein
MTSVDRPAAESKTKGSGLVLVLLLIWALAGCSAARKTADAVVETSSDVVDWVLPGGRPDLRQTVALIGVESSLPSVQAGFADQFRQALPGFLKKDCAEAVIDEAGAAVVKTPPRLPSGLLDGYALSVLGRQRGVNFFLIGTLVDVRVKDEPKGFWLWKDTRYSIQTVVRLEVVDSATGAKILDDTSRTETEIDSLKYEEIEQFKTIPFDDLTPAVTTLFRKGGKRVCSAMHSLPWQGFVVAAERGRITLSAGSRAGLSAGRMLEVFKSGPVFTSKDGQRFLSAGEKVGEATLTTVSEDRAEAVFGGWERLKEGGTAQEKK